MLGNMKIADTSGHTTVTWDTEIKAQVTDAAQQFEALVQQGYTAYAFKRAGEPGEVATKFDPQTEKITMMPRAAGG